MDNSVTTLLEWSRESFGSAARVVSFTLPSSAAATMSRQPTATSALESRGAMPHPRAGAEPHFLYRPLSRRTIQRFMRMERKLFPPLRDAMRETSEHLRNRASQRQRRRQRNHMFPLRNSTNRCGWDAAVALLVRITPQPLMVANRAVRYSGFRALCRLLQRLRCVMPAARHVTDTMLDAYHSSLRSLLCTGSCETPFRELSNPMFLLQSCARVLPLWTAHFSPLPSGDTLFHGTPTLKASVRDSALPDRERRKYLYVMLETPEWVQAQLSQEQQQEQEQQVWLPFEWCQCQRQDKAERRRDPLFYLACTRITSHVEASGRDQKDVEFQSIARVRCIGGTYATLSEDGTRYEGHYAAGIVQQRKKTIILDDMHPNRILALPKPQDALPFRVDDELLLQGILFEIVEILNCV